MLNTQIADVAEVAEVVIIGGGLSGLYAAYLLEQSGITDYVLLEARNTFGGRIESARPLTGLDRYDLGATWFWPEFQPQLDALIHALQLPRLGQYESGDMLVEQSPAEPAIRTRSYFSASPSVRLAGGMAALTDALQSRLSPACLRSGRRVQSIDSNGSLLRIEALTADGQHESYQVGHVLLAVPPRLASSTIEFTPALPQTVARMWSGMATWMAPHAKYLAVYDTPFWREQGLSGQARSTRGPLAEIHDASGAAGGALFGFIGVAADTRSQLGDEALRAHCRAQLVRLFGPLAASPRVELVRDWAAEPYTATGADLNGFAQHAQAPVSTMVTGPWCARITGIASEWSPQFSGYVAGAIDAATRGVQALIKERV